MKKIIFLLISMLVLSAAFCSEAKTTSKKKSSKKTTAVHKSKSSAATYKGCSYYGAYTLTASKSTIHLDGDIRVSFQDDNTMGLTLYVRLYGQLNNMGTTFLDYEEKDGQIIAHGTGLYPDMIFDVDKNAKSVYLHECEVNQGDKLITMGGTLEKQ